jgi:hypothetical protein
MTEPRATTRTGASPRRSGQEPSRDRGGDLPSGLDPGAIRGALGGRALRPYEILFDTDRWGEAAGERAERIMSSGWDVGGGRVVGLRAPIGWDSVLADDRSRHFHLHSWFPLGPILSGFDNTGDDRYLRFALDVALDWIEEFPAVDGSSPFAWYDMAIGVRALRLGYLIDAVARSPLGTDAVLTELARAALLHRDALADEGLFPAHSNHGFYFAAGQAALAARLPEFPGMSAASAMARERLERLVRNHFTVEGVHREHSPKYHWMVLDTIAGLRAAGLLEGEEHARTLQRIQDALAWFVLPNGRLAMFGDTDHRLMVGIDWPHLGTDALRFVLSGGREGAPPGEPARAFPASGYVVFRSGWPTGPDDFGNDAYLAQACAFHSRTHKHADDLTLIWYDRGHELLVDGGGYGYAGKTKPGSELWKDGFWYADPRRIYVESTRSHNTVEVDGRNLPRRNVEPYGSALMRWGEKAGVYHAESAVCHWETICHRRILLFRPSEWLLVFDWLLDEESLPHTYRQHFHFAPELEVAASGADRLVLALPGDEAPLHMVSLSPGELIAPVKGQEKPDLLGWISRQDRDLIPCWTSGFQASGHPDHTFATLFAFGEDAPMVMGDPGLQDPEANRFRLSWSQGGRIHTLSFDRSTQGPFGLDYRMAVPSVGRGSGGGG